MPQSSKLEMVIIFSVTLIFYNILLKIDLLPHTTLLEVEVLLNSYRMQPKQHQDILGGKSAFMIYVFLKLFIFQKLLLLVESSKNCHFIFYFYCLKNFSNYLKLFIHVFELKTLKRMDHKKGVGMVWFIVKDQTQPP